MKETESLLQKDPEGKEGGKGVKVRRILLLEYYLPDSFGAEGFSITSLNKNADNLQKWIYWVNAKRVIQHHIRLMIKYPLAGYEFKLYFVKQDGFGPLKNKIGHYALLKTQNGDITLFEVEKNDSKEVQSSLVKTLTSTHRFNKKAIDEVMTEFSELLDVQKSIMHVITEDHMSFIDTLKDEPDIAEFISNNNNQIALLGQGCINPMPSLKPLNPPNNENINME